LPKSNGRIETVAPHQASLRHHDRHTPRVVDLASASGLQSCCPPRRSNNMVETPPEAEAHRSLSFRPQPSLTLPDLARRPLDLAKRREGPGATDATCLHDNRARPAARRISDDPWPQHYHAPATAAGHLISSRRPMCTNLASSMWLSSTSRCRSMHRTSPGATAPSRVDVGAWRTPHHRAHGSAHTALIRTCLTMPRCRTTSMPRHGRRLASLDGRRNPR
jgi:hypothetical protein